MLTLTSRLRSMRRETMFSITRKMRAAIVVLVAAAAFGLTATSAFALSASQKQANFHSCLALGGTWQSCCVGSGGTYNHFQYPFTGQWLESCAWSGDSQTQPIASRPFASNVFGGGTPPPAA